MTDVDDARWTVDAKRHFVGMDCTVSRPSGEVSGTIEAVWLFRGGDYAHRRRHRRRPARQHRQGARQLRARLVMTRTFLSESAERMKQDTRTHQPLRDKRSAAKGGLRTSSFSRAVSIKVAHSASGNFVRPATAFGRRTVDTTHDMRIYASSEQSERAVQQRHDRLQQDTAGTTTESVEEESTEKSVSHPESSRRDGSNPAPCGGLLLRSALAAVSSAFNTTTYWYQYSTIPSIHPTGWKETGTSPVPLHLQRRVDE